MLTRRALIGSTSSLMSLAVIGGGGAALFGRGFDMGTRLQRDLDLAVRQGSGTRLDVLGLTPAEGGPATRLTAVVQMHWRPGYRRHCIEGDGADAEQAYQALLAGVIQTFRTPNPGGFA